MASIPGLLDMDFVRERSKAFWRWLLALHVTKAFGFVAVFAIAGVVLLLAAHAATVQPIAAAPQTGQLCGNISVVPNASALGGTAVEFGTGSSACTVPSSSPTNLQAFTGGNNIALVWDMPTVPVQSIQVWRNNTQIATVVPDTSSYVENQYIGKEYDDNAVSMGNTYQYKVRAVLADGTTSAFTPSVTATQPTQSAGVPTIKLDTTGMTASEITIMQNELEPVLRTWYPKDANELAYPAYIPPSTLDINFTNTRLAGGCDTSATQGSDVATISCTAHLVGQSVVSAENGIAALFVHESTHAIQDAANGPGWTVEGGASWSSDFYARQNINSYIPHAGEQIAAYTPGAWFIEFMRENYNANFPRDLNIAIHDGTYSDSLFSQDTAGKLTSQTQAWQAAVHAYNTSAGTITGVGGKCIEVQNGTVANGTKLVLDDCNAQSQRLVTNAVFKPGVGSNLCLDDDGGSGTVVDIWNCVSGAMNESWTVLGNGEVVGESSHTCLTNQGGSNTSANPVVLSSCNGGASQLWTVGGNLIKNTATGLCLTDPNSSTTLNTPTTEATCNGAANQRWTPSGQITTNGDLAQQWALTYHNASKTGLFEITSPTLGNPTGTIYCMDDQSSGTADGTIVQYWGCDQTNAQYWTYDMSNNAIVNVNANKCLSTQNGASANGTQLVIRACDGGADQKWTVPS